MFAIALWDRLERRLVLARDRFGIKPLYYRRRRTATLSFASELKALLRQPGHLARGRPRRARGLPRLQLDPGAADDLPRGAQAAARPPADRGSGGEPTLRRYARPRPVAAGRERAESEQELARRAARAPARLRARASRRRRAGGRAAVGRHRLVGARRAGRARELLPRQHVLDRLRGALLRRARAGAAGRRAVRHRPPRAGRAPGRRRAAAAARGGLRRAVRGLVRAADLPRLAARRRARSRWRSRARAATSCSAATTPTWPTRSRRASGRVASALRPLVERAAELLRPKVSFDYKAKRFARAAHLPPLERHHAWKEIFSPEARAALLDGRRGAVDPLDVYRARYAETEGADELARLQDVDIGIYLVDDLLVKTDRASMAHSLEARVPFCDPVVAELALALPRSMKVRGPREEAAAAPGGRRRCCRETIAARAASRASRSRRPPGCAASCEPFAREVLSPRRSRAQGFFEPDGRHRA